MRPDDHHAVRAAALGVSPMTFAVCAATVAVSTASRSRTSPACARPNSSSPTAKLVVTAGIVTGPVRVPWMTSWRPGWPSLKISTAA